VKSIKIIPILLVLALVPVVHGEGNIYIPAASQYVYFEFDQPKGPDVTFDEVRSVTIYNYDENNSLSVSGFSASVSGLSGLEVGVEKTDFGIGAASSIKIDLTFTIPASTAEGKHYATLELSGTGVTTEKENITIEVKHPPATLEATWDEADWGNLKAGSTFTRTLKILEVMGYKDAENVSLVIDSKGPAKLNYSGTIGNISASTLKSVEVEVSVPERGLTPGDYDVSPIITTGGSSAITPFGASYTIPYPVMELESTTIDFGQITFETGKDYSHRTLVVKETGGFTPIEDLSITLYDGEKGWITYTSQDYIPAGGSEEFTFVVYLPQDASLGKRYWDYLIDAPYVDEDEFEAVVQVYFPGIDEAVSYLEGRSPVEGYPETGTLIGETLDLLKVGRDKTEIKKIAMVMSIYGGTRSFLNLLEDASSAIGSGDLSRGGDLIIRGYDSINKIKIGNSNIYDADLKLYSSSIETISLETWKNGAGDILEILEEKARESEETDYKSAALYYKRISTIYSLLGDSDSSKEYDSKRLDMEEKYTRTIEEAAALQIDADSSILSANAMLYAFQDVFLVLNPFNYERVSALYSSAIEGYARAGEKYRLAGEEREADVSREYSEELAKRKQHISLLFGIYGLFWTLLFVWLVARISLGLQRFRQDELDGLIGDVAVRQGKLEEAEA
jgi:hypothetical protein